MCPVGLGWIFLNFILPNAMRDLKAQKLQDANMQLAAKEKRPAKQRTNKYGIYNC